MYFVPNQGREHREMSGLWKGRLGQAQRLSGRHRTNFGVSRIPVCLNAREQPLDR